MQELPSYIPPNPYADNPSWDPNGPVGRLVDVSTHYPMTIGQLVQAGAAPPFGWMPGERNTAIPLYTMPGQPSQAEIMAMMASQNYAVGRSNTDAELMTTLLIIMF